MSACNTHPPEAPTIEGVKCLIDCIMLVLRYKNVERHIINTPAWSSLVNTLTYVNTPSSQALRQRLTELNTSTNPSAFEIEHSKVFVQALRDALLELVNYLEHLEAGQGAVNNSPYFDMRLGGYANIP